MANANVKFYSVKLQATFDALAVKEANALYFIQETNRFYHADRLMGTGLEATAELAGLMSPEDKAKLDALVANSGSIVNLPPVDSTISVTDAPDGGKAIGVKIANIPGNALTAVDGGLFVAEATGAELAEYAIERQETAEDGYAASYKLKKTVGEEVTYVGDTINIAKDMVLQTAVLETAIMDDVPYEGAKVGDPYIKMVFNDPDASALYIPVKGLVDTYSAGDGIEIIDNTIKIRLSENAHGLTVVDGALSLALATKDNDGAMSKEDKLVIESLPSVYKTKAYEVAHKPSGTLVNYGEDEIRVMCPANTEWKLQSSGENADANTYYIGFKAYAPSNAVSFKEDLAEIIADDEMYYFENNDFAGEDLFGRKYSVVWLPVARFDGSAWTYYGASSSNEKYIGWYYTVEWYDANGVLIDTDTVRINLSNEDCHNNAVPYYMGRYATVERVESVEEKIVEVEGSYTWGVL